MLSPRVIAEGPRWRVLHKPPGWSIDRQGPHPSLKAVFDPVYGPDLFFPLRLEADVTGLVPICHDKGMLAQFTRHLQEGRVKRSYRFLCNDVTKVKLTSSQELEPTLDLLKSVKVSQKLHNGLKRVELVEIEKSRASVIRAALSHLGLSPFRTPDDWLCMQLFRLTFPDPISPTVNDITVEMAEPGEWSEWGGAPDDSYIIQ